MQRKKSHQIEDWLPVTKKEMAMRGWEQADVILFSGDAYVDHPSFGAAAIGRTIEAQGLRVVVVPQPNWRDDLRDFKKFGVPKYFFAVTAGNMDSMVNHYTANKRLRSNDAYTPGGKAGMRPDYATVVYSRIIKKLYPEVPLLIGGIEASLRRLTHYDYWSDQLKPSILWDTKADLLIYGNGEKPLIELIDLLKKGVEFTSIKTLKQTAYIINNKEYGNIADKWGSIVLNDHEHCLKNKKAFAENFRFIEEEANKIEGKRLVQSIQQQMIIVNPIFAELNSKELDRYYAYPFTRLPHPKYAGKGNIPAYEMIKHSVTLHRGCFGGCAFCTIAAHQGKFISSRSQQSIIKEVEQIVEMEDFKGHVTDLGGPSANMYLMRGKNIELCKRCSRPSCLHPGICKNLITDHQPLIELYKSARKIEGIKKISIGSGIRYDLFLNENNEPSYLNYFSELVKHHVSGRLKVAPEHTSEKVLKLMRKPPFSLFYRLNKLFEQVNKRFKLNQQLIPYFISSHPGSEENDMKHLANETKKLNFKLEQIQDFTPTPMTLATVIYYSGFHPYTLEKVYTAKTKEQKLKQRSYFFWYKKEASEKRQKNTKMTKR